MKNWLRATSLSLGLALALPAANLFAEGLGPLTPDQRQALMDTVRQLHQDPQFQALKGQLKGNLNNRAAVDNYLRYLPISPLQMLRVEMEMGRFEFAIPPVVHQQEQRWLELHPGAAAGAAVAELGEVESGSPTEARLRQAVAAGIAGTNRNAGATGSPAPLDYQGEIQVAVNPNNPSQIVAAANTWDDMGGTCGTYGLQAVFYSGDGGATWNYTCPPNDTAYGLSCAALGGGTFGSDPAVSWNANNEVFLNYMLICYNGSYFYSMVVARSANGGASWSAQGVIRNGWPTGTLEDKNFYAIDTNAGSPFFGRHYTCWDRSNNEKLAYSTNNGVAWTEVDLPTAGGGIDLGCDIAVQKNGTVHVIWNSLSCGVSTCTNEATYYSRSTNGGVTWSAPVLVVDPNLVGFSNGNCPSAQDDRCIGPFGSIDVDNSGGACDGTLYVTYSDFPSGRRITVNNSDVFVTRSTNNGSTWGTPVRVNDDASGGNIQFNAFLVVDQVAGNPVVAWQDARNDTNNRKMDIYTSRSTNCGVSFEANTKASGPSGEFNNSTISYSDHNSQDNPNYNPNQTGEYMGLDARGGKAYIAWSDTRHYFPSFTTEAQKDNVGFAVVDFSAVDTTPPAAPTGLTTTPGKRKITLNWTANTEPDLAGYNVYRSSSATGTFTKLNSSLLTTTTYTNSSLTSGSTWYYRVTAVDTSNNESAPSATVSGTAN